MAAPPHEIKPRVCDIRSTPTNLPDLALLLSVAILGFVVTNLLNLAVLLYLVTVVVLGWIVVNRQ